MPPRMDYCNTIQCFHWLHYRLWPSQSETLTKVHDDESLPHRWWTNRTVIRTTRESWSNNIHEVNGAVCAVAIWPLEVAHGPCRPVVVVLPRVDLSVEKVREGDHDRHEPNDCDHRQNEAGSHARLQRMDYCHVSASVPHQSLIHTGREAYRFDTQIRPSNNNNTQFAASPNISRTHFGRSAVTSSRNKSGFTVEKKVFSKRDSINIRLMYRKQN